MESVEGEGLLLPFNSLTKFSQWLMDKAWQEDEINYVEGITLSLEELLDKTKVEAVRL